MDWSDRLAELLRRADTLRAYEPHWASFLEAVWNSTIPELFPTADDRRRLEQTVTYAQLVEWREQLRVAAPKRPKITLSVITIRIPSALHTLLVRDAADRGVSLNELCVGRLLNFSRSKD